MASNHKQPKEYLSQHIVIVYFVIIFDIDIHGSKQSKTSIPSINEWKSEIFSVIDAVVIDIHQPTQTEKWLFDNFFQCKIGCCIW